ncbi:hypothetical protein BKA81DRAFT_161586 [Phyllosticta paracitricarpa]
MGKVNGGGPETNQTTAGHESELHGARAPAPVRGREEGVEVCQSVSTGSGMVNSTTYCPCIMTPLLARLLVSRLSRAALPLSPCLWSAGRFGLLRFCVPLILSLPIPTVIARTGSRSTALACVRACVTASSHVYVPCPDCVSGPDPDPEPDSALGHAW